MNLNKHDFIPYSRLEQTTDLLGKSIVSSGGIFMITAIYYFHSELYFSYGNLCANAGFIFNNFTMINGEPIGMERER